MSIVADLREALQDVVAPDLKAVVRGLTDVKECIAQLRDEMKNSNALLRDDLKSSNALLRDEMAAVEARTAERLDNSEKRTAERIERLYDTIKISDLTRRNEQLLRELEQARNNQQTQQQ